MKDWLAFRNTLAAIGMWAGMVGLIGLLLANGVTLAIISEPEQVAEGFVRALKAHRFEGAFKELGQEAQSQTSPQALKEITVSLEAAGRPINGAYGLESKVTGNTATATVRIEINSQIQQVLTFKLVKENAQWKVASIDPLSDWLRQQ